MSNNMKEKRNASNVRNGILFKAEMSRGISGFYWLTILLLGVLVGAIVLLAPLNTMEKILLIGLFMFIDIVLLYLLVRANRTMYILDQHDIGIYGAMGIKSISYENIESIQKSQIPSGLRLFGSSFLGGWYYLPGIGKTWVSMTNFNDGILISTKDARKYMITPKNPEKFIEITKERIPGSTQS